MRLCARSLSYLENTINTSMRSLWRWSLVSRLQRVVATSRPLSQVRCTTHWEHWTFHCFEHQCIDVAHKPCIYSFYHFLQHVEEHIFVAFCICFSFFILFGFAFLRIECLASKATILSHMILAASSNASKKLSAAQVEGQALVQQEERPAALPVANVCRACILLVVNARSLESV